MLKLICQNTAKEAPMQKKQSTSPVVVKAERLAPWLPDRASPGIAWAVLDPGAGRVLMKQLGIGVVAKIDVV